ncbi:hypothetical protein Y032_0009g791 [Ancylostoma ceylanicum]|nr:hypothetical protein Y032_0009g791 [Ancylostoma ceylanicum]
MLISERMSANYQYLLVFSTAVLLYSNTFSADFVYDDSQAILTNPVVAGDVPATEAWTLDFWGNPLTRASHKSYRPLTTLSFRINAALFGMSPLSFHVTNVLLHAVASCLVLKFVCRFQLFEQNPDAAVFTSLLFAVHPIHCEAVAGIVGRADVLAAVTVLAGILAFDQKENIVLATVLAALAMCFKETGIMLLPLLVVFMLLNPKKNSSDLRRSISGFVLAFIFLATLRHAINSFEPPRFSKSDNPVAHHPSALVRTLTFLYLPIFHLKLMIYPKYLSFDWSMDSIPLVRTPTDSRFLASAAFYAVLLVTGWKLARESGVLEKTWKLLRVDKHSHRVGRHSGKNSPTKTRKGECQNAARKILLALSLIILPFLPASNLICYIGFVAAERTLYLSSVGYCILAGLLYDFCCPRLGRTLTVSLAFLALTLHGTRTYTRNMDWMDEESLYKSALELNPPKAYSNLGRVYAAQLRLNDAEAAYKMALEHRPNMADTWYNLGVLYQERKNLTSAVKCYETAVKLRKTFATAYLNLGIVHHENGDDQEAATIWEKCSRIDGSTVKAQREHQQAQTSCRLRLGKLLIQKKELQRARNILEEAIHAAPRSYPFLASLWFSLGELYDALGQDVKAEAAFQAALQTSPEHIPSLLTMGHLKNRQNRTSESNSWFSRALTVSPNSPEVHHHIGMAAASRGDVAGAESAYINALELAGTHLESLRALATLLREQGRYDKSEQVLRTLQTHHPSSESYGDYGAILHLNGKLQKAKEFYEKSLQLDSKNNLVKENLRKLERKMASARLT